MGADRSALDGFGLMPLDWLSEAMSLAAHYAGIMLAGGLAVVTLFNIHAWRHERPLAAALRKERERSLDVLPRTPLVSILVAAWNEAAMIHRHMESVLALRYPHLEYLLCAGGADGTYELARRYCWPGVIVLEQGPGEGKQVALRRCLEHATGDVIFLTDADCILDDVSFERTLTPILQGQSEASTGGSRPLSDQLTVNTPAICRWAAELYSSAHAPAEGSGLLGRNTAVTRQAVEKAGAFRAHVPTGTDYHLAKSLSSIGIEIIRVRSSEVATHYPDDIRLYARQQRRWLRNVALLGFRFGAYREVAMALLTSVVGLGMLLAPIAALLLGPWLLSLWLVAVAHSAMSKARYLAFAASATTVLEPRARALAYATVIPITLLDFAVWASPLPDYLSEKGRTAW